MNETLPIPIGTILDCGVILSCMTETEFVKFKQFQSDFTRNFGFYHDGDLIRYIDTETGDAIFYAEKYEEGHHTTFKYTLLVLETEIVSLQTGRNVRFYKVLIVNHQVVRWIAEYSFDHNYEK